MFKKIFFGLVVVLLIGLAMITRFFLSNTSFSEKSKFFYIQSGHTAKEDVMRNLEENNILQNPASFQFLASQMNTWKRIKPGRYEIKKGMSLLELSRMLRNNKQAPVDLVITKLRTKEDLAALVARKFQTDSSSMMAFLSDEQKLAKYRLDTNTALTAVFPDTYRYLWTSPPQVIFEKLFNHSKKIWNETRRNKADSLGMDPVKAYILASIIEEETTFQGEKGLMASVYINRLSRNMNLGADPTVKFAMRNFSLKRIYAKHLATESPYNTYRNKGLPPGPICTPSLATLDAVLDAPVTDYLFFVAKKDFSQGHVFTSKYQDHLRYAREYRQALTKLEKEKSRQAREEIAE